MFLYQQCNNDLLCTLKVLLCRLQYYNSIQVDIHSITPILQQVNSYHRCKSILILRHSNVLMRISYPLCSHRAFHTLQLQYNKIRKHKFQLVLKVRQLHNSILQDSLYTQTGLFRPNMYQRGISWDNWSHKDNNDLLDMVRYNLLNKNRNRKCLRVLQYLHHQHKHSLGRNNQ